MLRVFYILNLLMVVLLCVSKSNSAASADVATPIIPPAFESYGGGDYNVYGVALYSNTVWSVDGAITDPGFRLRLSSLTHAYGRSGGSVFSGAFAPSSAKTAIDVMGGYAFGQGDVWFKVFAGVSAVTEVNRVKTGNGWKPFEIYGNEVYSAKLSLESWWRINHRLWASADLNWTGQGNDTAFYSRIGYDVIRFQSGLTLSLGAEVGGVTSALKDHGNQKYSSSDSAKGGGLFQVRYGYHDFTFSAGLSENHGEGEVRPYAALSYGQKF